MSKERLENEEIIKDNDQVEVEVEEKEDVDGNEYIYYLVSQIQERNVSQIVGQQQIVT